MITTTIEEWEKEYTNDEEWNTQKVKTVSDWGKITDKTIKKWVAEVRWSRHGKLIKEYIVTHYEFKYNEDYVKYDILERRRYKTRNAMMNKIRKLEEEKENAILLY